MNRRFLLRGFASLPFIGAAAALGSADSAPVQPIVVNNGPIFGNPLQDEQMNAWIEATRAAYLSELNRIPKTVNTKIVVTERDKT